jgi:hypothetical protein
MRPSSISAPIVASVVAATRPTPKWMLSWGSSQLPRKGTDNANDDIGDDSEPTALQDLTGEPSGNEANRQNDRETFARHVHLLNPL